MFLNEIHNNQVNMSVRSILLVLALFGLLYSSSAVPLTAVDTWKVKVFTANDEYAGTNADVVLTISGKTVDGQVINSQEVELDSPKNNFEKGRVDEFQIETVSVGQPFQIVIKHNNRGANPSWKLNRVELQNLGTDERYKFKCDCWLSEDAGLEKRILAEGFEVENWQVAVYTAIALKSGTNANVFLTIFGNRTDGVVVKSDQFELDSEKNNFKRSEVDYFRIETIKLGKPYQITISHDNTGIDPAWRLDRVELKNLATEEVFTFRCSCWLDDEAGLEKTIPVRKSA